MAEERGGGERWRRAAAESGGGEYRQRAVAESIGRERRRREAAESGGGENSATKKESMSVCVIDFAAVSTK